MSETFEIITNKIVEACQETVNELSEPDCPSEVKIKWVKHVLSGIETTNEQAEESGFVPIYNGSFKLDPVSNLDQQVEYYTKMLVQTIYGANDSYRQREIVDTKNLMNKNLSEILKDPVFCNFTIKQLMDMPFGKLLEVQKGSKKFKLQRMHWEGYLEEILHMLENFEDERDSDVDSCSEEDL
jgi:hypothetical protein